MGNISADVYGTSFFVMSKYNQNHDVLWSESYGGDETDQLSGVVELSDGFIAVCRSNSPISGTKTEEGNSFFHLWLVKLDFEGNNVWQKTIVYTSNLFLPSIYKLNNGNILISTVAGTGIGGDKTDEGYGNSDGWLVLIDQAGEIIWDKAIGTEEWDGFFNIAGQLSSGNIVLSCYSEANASGLKSEDSFGLGDAWFVCIHPENGNLIWDKTIGGASADWPDAAVIFNDNIFQNISSYSDVSGLRTENLKGIRDNWCVRLDDNGELIGQFSIGGSGNELNGIIHFAQQNSLLMTISSDSPVSIDKSEPNRGESDIWLVRTDFDGNILNQKTIGGNESDGSGFINILPNGNYLLIANSNSDISGEKTVPRIGPNSSDVWILEIDAVTLDIVNEHQIVNESIVYPNPVSNQINISFTEATQLNKAVLYDLNGKIVREQNYVQSFEQAYLFSTKGLAAGAYSLSLVGDGFVKMQQVVVE
jgi:hypothetical protein